MTTIDFISLRGPENFEDDAEINPIEIKIENDKIQNMFLKYEKKPCQIHSRWATFSNAIKNDTEKIFVSTGELIDAKYGLIKGKLCQTTRKIKLNKINNQYQIKESSPWVNINFQAQGNNRETKHFTYNFITKNMGGMLNCRVNLIDDENKATKFEDKEKNFPIANFFD